MWGGGSNTPKPVNIGQKAFNVSCSDSATLLLTQSGNLLVCQDPSQLPRFQVLTDNRSTKQGKEIVAAAVGMDHTTAVSHDGQIFMWNAYPPHSPQSAQQIQPMDVELPGGGKQKAIFVACGASHTLSIISQSRLNDSTIRENGSPNGANNLHELNGSIGVNGNGMENANGNDASEELLSDSTTQQTIARLRSKLASTPTRARSPLRSPTPATPTNPTLPQSSLYSHQSSLALLSSRINALGNFNQSRKLEESLNSATLNGNASGLKRQLLSSSSTPSSLSSFSWRSSVHARRHSDLDSEDIGLQPKQTKQSLLFPSDDIPPNDLDQDDAKLGGRNKNTFRGIYDYLRGIFAQ